MSMRLYPDIIVASEIKDSLDDIVLISKKNNEDGENNYFKYIFKVYISAEQCVRHQKAYTKRGLGNVFLGYEGRDWAKDDFNAYFNSNPSIFTRLEDSGDKYEVNLGESFKKLDNIKDGKVQSCIRNFCSNLLTQETYNPRVLKKFGFA